MIALYAALCVLAVPQADPTWVQATPLREPLHRVWLEPLGKVSVYGEGRRLEIAFEGPSLANEQTFELDELPITARIRAARAGGWMTTGIAVVLAIEDGETTSYHYLLSRELPLRSEPFRSADLDGSHGWFFLSKAIFTSTGEPYRIVDVNGNQGQGDPLEITFRRGWVKPHDSKSRVDEKILFDSCGGYSPDPFHRGLAILCEMTPAPR